MKKEYISPLFEEVVLITEDVLDESPNDNYDNRFGDTFNDYVEKDGDFGDF